MGHVPTGPVPAEGSGPQFPRRQHRRAGARRPTLSDPARHRFRVGRDGERFAADLLERHGAVIESRNLRIDGGELDLVVRFGKVRVAVEVKALVTDGSAHAPDPFEHFDRRKSQQVWSLARAVRCRRVDVVTVTFQPEGVLLRWVPNAQ